MICSSDWQSNVLVTNTVYKNAKKRELVNVTYKRTSFKSLFPVFKLIIIYMKIKGQQNRTEFWNRSQMYVWSIYFRIRVCVCECMCVSIRESWQNDPTHYTHFKNKTPKESQPLCCSRSSSKKKAQCRVWFQIALQRKTSECLCLWVDRPWHCTKILVVREKNHNLDITKI